MILFDFTLFGHNYGIGVIFDWTLLVHALVYGGTVWGISVLRHHIIWPYGGSVRLTEMSDASKRTGLFASLTAALYLELLQMWRYHWNCGMFGIADFAVSWGAAFGVYFILKNSKH